VRDKFKSGLSSAAFVVLVGATLVVINLISVYLFSRLDLTEGRVFSLSQASKDIVANLDDKVIIKLYFSEDLPPPYDTYARYLKDKLEEYRAYARGNLKLELIDPIKQNKEMEAQRHGIPPIQVNVMGQDKMEIKKVYMGLVLLYENKKEVLPVVQNLSGLEYELSRTIKKLSSRFMPSIGFLTGHEEPDLASEMANLNSVLSREYSPRNINLKGGSTVPLDIKCLLIVGPKTPFSDWEKYALDQYLMQGGKVGLFLDKTDMNLQMGMANLLDLGLDDFLANYGIKVNDDLVIDVQSSKISVRQQSGFMTISSSYAAGKNLSFIPLVKSSSRSGTQNHPFDANPFREFKRSDFDKSNLLLAAAVQGSFESYFKDKEAPEPEEPSAQFVRPESTLTRSPDNRMVVVGDADFIKDRSIRSQSNLIFFMNVVDWLSQDENLIAIRSKEVTSRPLKQLSSGQKKLARYANVLGLPVVVILFGLLRWRIRKQVKGKQL